jgi:hypothetical protein
MQAILNRLLSCDLHRSEDLLFCGNSVFMSGHGLVAVAVPHRNLGSRFLAPGKPTTLTHSPTLLRGKSCQNRNTPTKSNFSLMDEFI